MRTQFMRKLSTSLLIWGGLLLFVAPVDGQVCYDGTLWTVSRDDNIVREIDAETLTEITTHEIDLGPANPVAGLPGIGWDATTGNMYLLIQFENPPGGAPFLANWDVLGGTIDVIGGTVVNFDCLSIDGDGIPHALATSTASPPNAFCELSLITGGPTDLCAVTNTDIGQSIAFHPSSSNFYQASGAAVPAFREITGLTGAGVPCTTTTISPLSPDLGADGVGAICWSVPREAFLWKAGGVGDALYEVDSTGGSTLIGTLDHAPTDMTVSYVTIPCIGGEFQRGDANTDGGFDVSDPVFTLAALFIPGSDSGTCQDSIDANDDGVVDISDPVFMLAALFIPGSPSPPEPSPGACGPDPTMDAVECVLYDSCP